MFRLRKKKEETVDTFAEHEEEISDITVRVRELNKKAIELAEETELFGKKLLNENYELYQQRFGEVEFLNCSVPEHRKDCVYLAVINTSTRKGITTIFDVRNKKIEVIG